MKKYRFQHIFIIVIVITLICGGCNNEYGQGGPSYEEKQKDLFISAIVNDINSDSLRKYVIWLQNMNTRFMLAGNHRQIAEKLMKKFIQLGYPETRLDSFNITTTYDGVIYNTWQFNVIATLRGVNYPDSISVIGAHYDDIIADGTGDPFLLVPGANDNASGVAATLEIARIIKKESFIPASTIHFVTFAAEELGLYGSYDYAQKANARQDNIIMMLNNDMIAFPASTSHINWCVNIIDYNNSGYLRSEAEELCGKHTFLWSINDNSLSGRSDSYPFYLNGFKPLFFIEKELGITYHTVDDLVTSLDFIYCREIAKISCAMLIDKNYIRQ